MKRSRRAAIVIFASIAAIFLLCAGIALFVVQSPWFENYVRLRIVSTIEKASGGKAELRSFDYDWRTLSVDMRGFVLHGSEPASAPPLFKAKRIHLGLKIVSILRKDVDIRDFVVDEPNIYLLVNPKGSTNLPRPATASRQVSVSEQILKLAIQHFELNRGTVELDNRRFALDIRGDRLRADVAYNPLQARYSGLLSSPDISVRSALGIPLTANFSTHFVFANDRAELDKAVIMLGQSRIEGHVAITHFADAHAVFDLKGALNAPEAARTVEIPGISAGTLAFTGSGSYAEKNYSFKGSIDGSDLAYRERTLALSGISLNSLLAIDNHQLSLNGLRAKAAGATLTGDLILKDVRDLSFNGQFKGLSIREAGRLFLHRPLPWDGYASGGLRVSADTKQWPRTAELSATADIVPGSHGIPVGGQLQASYSERSKLLRFGDSRLKLPNSTIEFSGAVGEVLHVSLDTANLQDLEPAIALASLNRSAFALSLQLEQGHLQFDGLISGDLSSPSIQGHFVTQRLRYRRFLADTAQSNITLNSQQLTISGLRLTQGSLRASASGQLSLTHWRPELSSNIHLHADFQGAEIQGIWTQIAPAKAPWLTGTVNADGDIAGTIDHPSGSATITATGITARGEHIDSVDARLQLAGDHLAIERGSVRAGAAALSFTAGYRRSSTSWDTGRVDVQLNSDRFQMEELATVRRFEPGLTGQAQINIQAAATVRPGRVALQALTGEARMNSIAVDRIPYGNLVLRAATENEDLKTTFSGNLRDCRFDGSSKIQLKGDYQGEGTLKFSPLKFSTIKALIPFLQKRRIPFDGMLQGETSFHGPFGTPSAVAGSIRISQFQVNPQLAGIVSQAEKKIPAFSLQNAEPVLIDYLGQRLTVRSFRLTGTDTTLSATGQMAFNRSFPLNLTLNGSLNLQTLSVFDQSLQAKGVSRMNASITGPISAPILTGSLEIQDSSVYSDAFANGLDHANGLIRFDGNRATIQRLTAQSGGGHVAVGGFISFGGVAPLSYRLQASADAVRFRYNGISVTSNADLHYTGSSENSLLSGNITVTKAAFNPNTDVGSLVSNSMPIATASTETGLLHRIRLEVDVQSASTLELTTSLSQDVQADIDLRLRGTPDRPIVLGRVSVNEGQIQFFGSKYTINRGEVNFVNPVKVEPVLDLNLQTQARGVTINITISGTLDKLNVSYRSDPPLQSSEIIALLATGRTPGTISGLASSQSANQNNALSAGANTILGSTVSPVSGRLERFFGITHLKIDPMLQGIEDVPQARVTLEQQISREVTVTYVTNLSRTSQQIFRFEWALSREYSLVAIRDENGLFGVDLEYKKRFK